MTVLSDDTTRDKSLEAAHNMLGHTGQTNTTPFYTGTTLPFMSET